MCKIYSGGDIRTSNWSPSLTDCTEVSESTEFCDRVLLLGEMSAGCCSSSSSFFSREVKSTPDCCSSVYVPFFTMWPWNVQTWLTHLRRVNIPLPTPKHHVIVCTHTWDRFMVNTFHDTMNSLRWRGQTVMFIMSLQRATLQVCPGSMMSCVQGWPFDLRVVLEESSQTVQSKWLDPPVRLTFLVFKKKQNQERTTNSKFYRPLIFISEISFFK